MSKKASRTESDRKISPGLIIIICLLLVIATAIVTYVLTTGGLNGREYIQSVKNYAEIERTISDNYIGEIEPNAMHGAASAAMVRALGDKWSYYMTAEEYATYKLSSANEYAGVGMNIASNKDGEFEINSVTQGTPAAAAGLAEGDTIVSVDGQKVKGLSLMQVQDLIRSKLNKDFDMVVADPSGENLSVSLKCAAAYVSPVSFNLMEGSIGYVAIKNFEAGCADDVKAAIEYLISSGATSFVFDLRDNPGGLFSELAGILDYLLPDGNLYTSVDRDGNKEVVKSDKICLKYKMAVIVNENTYSAAEFFAAAIQEYNWGSVVGAQTSGKGRSQITVELSNGDAIHISTCKYLTSKGVDIVQTGGITPNVVVTLNDENDGDEQIAAAIKAIETLS